MNSPASRFSLVALLMGAAIFIAPGCVDRASDRFLSIGTGGTGGVYYPLGGALANRMSLRDPDRQYTAEVTGGSVENVNRIRERQIDLGFVLANSAYEAYHGGEDYPEAVSELRVVAPLYPNLTHVLVRGASTIRSLRDLAGMRVSVGPPGSGTEQHSRHLLEAADLGYGDIQVRYLSFAESAAALADGAIDAAIISVGYPAPAVLEATTTANVRLIGVSPEELDALEARYPYYSAGEIPPGIYRSVVDPVPTIAIMNWIVGSEALPDDVARLLLDVLDEERAWLSQAHEMAGRIEMASLRDAPIPLHAGAAAWLHFRSGQ